MTATTHPTPAGTAAGAGWLPSLAGQVLEFVWPMFLTLVLTLGAWVLGPTLLLGWQPVAIISGSMAPAVPPGHVVLVEPFRGQDVGPGTVVTYRDPRQDRLVTHRISAVQADGTITTRGDSSAVDDPVPLTADRIVGVGRLVVPAVGLPALWAHDSRVDLLAGVAVLTVLTFSSATSAAATGVRAVRRQLSLRRGTRQPASSSTVGLVTGVASVLAVLAASAVSVAAFVGVGQNPANTFEAGTVPAPTITAATDACPASDPNAKGARRAIELAWDAIPNASGYEAERATDTAGPFTPLGTVSGTCLRDTDVNAATTYHYRVRAHAGPWTSAWGTTSAEVPRGPR